MLKAVNMSGKYIGADIQTDIQFVIADITD